MYRMKLTPFSTLYFLGSFRGCARKGVTVSTGGILQYPSRGTRSIHRISVALMENGESTKTKHMGSKACHLPIRSSNAACMYYCSMDVLGGWKLAERARTSEIRCKNMQDSTFTPHLDKLLHQSSPRGNRYILQYSSRGYPPESAAGFESLIFDWILSMASQFSRQLFRLQPVEIARQWWGPTSSRLSRCADCYPLRNMFGAGFNVPLRLQCYELWPCPR